MGMLPAIDLSDMGVVRVGERRIRVTPMEWEIICLMARRPGEFIHRERMMQSLYGLRSDPPNIEVLSVHLCHLRKRLKDSGVAIGNRFNFGWYLKPE